MRSPRAAWFALLVLPLLAAAAAEPTADPDPGFDYDAELARLRLGETSVDFRRLRFGGVGSEGDSPYDLDEGDTAREAMKAIRDGDCVTGLALADKILQRNYLYPAAHELAARCDDALGRTAERDFHRAVLAGIFRSICAPGEGRERSKPCPVIGIHEEYFYLNARGLRLSKQALTTCAGKPCDAMTATDPETGETVTLYFDVSVTFENR